MKKELFINTRGNTNVVAVMEGGKLVEFNSENDNDALIVGNIYRGRVEQVVKGMQAIFVNIGRAKNAYLFLGETIIDGQSIALPEEKKLKKVQDFKPGDNVMVQVSKTEIGTKGARLTSNISIAGRYLVYMPEVDYIGVSRKIENEEARQRLTDLMENMPDRHGGFILRTVCKDATEEEILNDAYILMRRWKCIQKAYETTPECEVCHNNGGILYRTVRDLTGGELERIVVDDAQTFEKMKEYLNREGLNADVLSLFESDEVDLFNYYGLTSKVLRVLDSKVELENGAYLIIEDTEALTVVDVNTGKFVGSVNLEETVFETNMLAARAIASQLRLRNIGGIIIVDFIDMVNEEHKRLVVEELAEAVKRDRVRTSVIGMTPLGLVEITRKKSRNESKKKLSRPCKVCGGKGYIMTNESLANMIKSKLFRIFQNSNVQGCLIELNVVNMDDFFEYHAFTFETTVFWQDKRIYFLPNESVSLDYFKITVFEQNVFDIPQTAKLLY